MDWSTALGCLWKFTLLALAVFGAFCIAAIRSSRRLHRGVKAAVEAQPKPKQGRVVLREIVEGMRGMEDSYTAEIRDLGSGDTRFHVYDVNGNLIMEAPACECYKFALVAGLVNTPRDKQTENDSDVSHAADESEGEQASRFKLSPAECRHPNRYHDTYTADVICPDCGTRFVYDGLQLKPKVGKQIEKDSDET